MNEGILAEASRTGMAGRVLLTGYVDEEDLAALYSGAELFVMPSLYEGFCMPVLEAMACGTAVACSNASSLPEVVGDAGMTFDPRDVADIVRAIKHLLSSEALRAELVARGRERCRQFTWSACARIVLDTLEQVVGPA
jgi:alpha-1,3-rhamnosyl/mannosyltransferase